MDKQALAVMIPVLAVFFTGLTVLARVVLGSPRNRRFRGEAAMLGEDVHQHLLDVQTEMAAMRQELLETQERLDFAERLLARQDESGRLGASHGEG